MTSESMEIFFRLLCLTVIGDRMTDDEKVDVEAKISPDVLSELFDVSDAQDLAHLIGYALIDNGFIKKGCEMYDKFYAAQFIAMCRYETLNRAFMQVSEQFEKAKIEYLPLKGIVVRHFYPNAWMRTSCDIDILVRRDNYKMAIESLENAGWTVIAQTPHDISLQLDGGPHIELHYQLIEEKRLCRAYEVLDDVWLHVLPISKCEFAMSDEYFYFYHIAHMAKHFLNGGCGIRPFIDLWLLNTCGEFNYDCRRQLLAKGDLISFENYATRLCSVWFGNGTHNKATLTMEKYIFNGSLYGTWDNSVSVHNSMKNGKWGYFLSRLWISYDNLRIKYPSLEGKKILMPIYQIRRWIDATLHTRNKVRFELEKTNAISNDERDEMKYLLNELGIKR